MSGWDAFKRESSLNAPVAAAVIDGSNEGLPIAEAEIYLDTEILKKRFDRQIYIALLIVKTAYKAADEKEITAGIKSAFGWVFDSKSLKEDADKNRKDADKIRENGIKLGLSYMALAMLFETGFWLVEQGLVKAAYRKFVSGLKSIKDYFINSKTQITSDNQLDSSLVGIEVASAIDVASDQHPAATVVAPPDLNPCLESTNQQPLTTMYNTLPSAPAHAESQVIHSLPIAKPVDHRDNKNSSPNAPGIEITNSLDKKKISY